MEILLRQSSSLFLQSHYLLHSTNNACASAQHEAVQQAHANTKGLLTALELALRLSADETPLTPTVPTHAWLPEAVVFLVVATLLVGIRVAVMAHYAGEKKPPGTTYGLTESIVDVEMGITAGWDAGVGLLPQSTVVLSPSTTYGSTESAVDAEMGFTSGWDTGVDLPPQSTVVLRPDNTVVRLQAWARGCLTRTALRKDEGFHSESKSDEIQTESEPDSDEVQALLAQAPCLTDSEILEVVRSLPLALQDVTMPRCVSAMPAPMSAGLQLMCDRLSGGRGDDGGQIEDEELWESLTPGSSLVTATKTVGSMMFRSAIGGQVALIDGITAIDSLKAAPMLLTYLERWTEARILICESARSAETWWVKQGFQYAFKARTGSLCSRADVLARLSGPLGDAQGSGPDGHRIAKFIHAQAKHSGHYFSLLYRWVEPTCLDADSAAFNYSHTDA
ncbi:unnamed protein product [Symbiodinium natans]|uniref:Uncharacterized protein n=1 Tax=Symbiodinium natans TaxID=878477 RepID=A0A812PW48_9DINO|nr:unnamed protein product [Symbiodinium natans]